MKLFKCLLVLTCLISGVIFAEESKSDSKGFVSVGLGYEKFNIENVDDAGDVFDVGLNGGQLFKLSESLGYKWFVGFDTGKNKYDDNSGSDGKTRLTNFLVGFDGVIYMGTPIASFNVGPVLAINRVKDKDEDVIANTAFDTSYSLWGLSLGLDAGFSFSIVENFAIDFGLRYMLPLASFNQKCEVAGSDCGLGNTPDVLESVSHLYLNFTTYL